MNPGYSTPSKQDIIDWILTLMARHNLTWADIEEPDNPTEPENNGPAA